MRRAGVEKLGYFPIPPEMMAWIAAQLRVEAGTALSIIDPCMGEGAALKLLADQLHVQGAAPVVYGCEISRVRHTAAVKQLLNEKRDGISRLLHGPAEFLELVERAGMGDNSKYLPKGCIDLGIYPVSGVTAFLPGPLSPVFACQAGGTGISSKSLTRHRRRARPAAIAGVLER